MRARLAGVTKFHGAQVVLENASLDVGPRARIGLVGPNGVGKSTVLRLLAGEEAPDAGVVALDPPRATVAHLRQEPERRLGETLRGRLARLTGVAAAERELEAAAAAFARDADNARGDSTQALSDRYDAALARFLALGGGDLDARAAATCARIGLGVDLDRPFDGLSGGEAARASLAAVLLAKADLLLLDEPTNDLDADGARAARGVRRRLPRGDRPRLARPGVPRPDGRAHRRDRPALARGSSSGRAAGPTTPGVATRRAVPRMRTLPMPLRTPPRAHDAPLDGGQRRGPRRRPRRAVRRRRPRGTNALRTKVRQAEKLLERNPLPEKPFEPWELRLELHSSGRLPSPVAGSPARSSSGVLSVSARSTSSSSPASDSPCRPERLGQVDARPRSARRARARGRHARDRAWRRGRRDRPGAGRLHVAASRCSRRSPIERASTRSTRARCSRSSGSARRTSSGRARRSRPVSAPARISPSSRPPA